MTKPASRTPGPWYVKLTDGVPFGIEAEKQHVASTCFTDDAAFIVRACNAHDDLVAALRHVFERWLKGEMLDAGSESYDVVRAALKRAEE